MFVLLDIAKLRREGQEIKVVLNHDVRTILIYADKEIVAEQRFATLKQAKEIAGYLGLEEVCFVRTMRSFLRVDGKKKGYKGNKKNVGMGYIDPESLLYKTKLHEEGK